MGLKPRASGADATLLGAFEATYGQPPAAGSYVSLFFKSSGLDRDQPLGDDPLLGQGRGAQDPFLDAITVDGPIAIPLDVRGTGWWLRGLLGAPVTTQVKATGGIAFSAQPANGSTITLNGTVWAFVSGAPGVNETQIGATLPDTLTALAADLDGSADPEVAKCTYAEDGTTLSIEHDTPGTGGNTFTVAASGGSNGTVSAGTLLGGGYSHAFTSGGALPSVSFEIGHPELSTPKFYRFPGAKLGDLSSELARSGPANGTVSVIAQGRTRAGGTIDPGPSSSVLQRFSQGRGTIKLAGTQRGAVTGGKQCRRTERGKQGLIALTMPGAPSETTSRGSPSPCERMS